VAKQQVVVIGLGRFGSAVARELERLGHEVLAIDRDEQRVNDIASDVTHALELDAADEDALRGAGAAEFGTAIVAISSDAEPSIFATMVLKRLGVQNVIAKAGSVLHGEILSRVGADRVVFPERETGLRLAHSFSVPHVVDYLDVAPGFGIEKIRPPKSFIGKRLGELDLKARFGITPLALRRGRQVFVNPTREEVVTQGDELIVISRDEELEQLARLAMPSPDADGRPAGGGPERT
jgi:trk system potassium uptake protein TrkA